MHRTLFTLLLSALVAGCFNGSRVNHAKVTPLPQRVSGPPFPATKRLTKQELDWYIQKAIAWMQVDRDPAPDGGSIRRGFVYGSVIERSRPIECVQSDDGDTVTVTIPQRIEETSEYWMVVQFDTHTGEVKTHGSRTVSKNV